METGMLHLHSILRYLVLFVGIWAVFAMYSGMSGKKPFSSKSKKPALFFLILMDLQLVVGLVLYFIGPLGYKNIQNQGFGEVMKNSVARFFGLEHAVGMLLALILVHIGYSITKKTDISDKKKFTKAFWFFLIAFIVMIAFIPWPFRESLGRGWMPM